MTLTASCHCGATSIELPHAPTEAHECNCSFCARTGAVWAYYQPDEMQVSQSEGRTYSASDGVNQHHFCGRCGMHAWGDSPDWASAYNLDGTPKAGVEAGTTPEARICAVNLRLIDDLDWSKVSIEKVDGRHNW